MTEILAISLTIISALLVWRLVRRVDRGSDSRRNSSAVVGALLITAIVGGVGLSLNPVILKNNLGYLYLVEVIGLIWLYGYSVRWRVLDLLRPSILSIAYLGLSMGLGGITYRVGAVTKYSTLRDFQTWTDISPVFVVMLTSFLTMFLVGASGRRAVAPEAWQQSQRQGSSILPLVFGVIFLAALFWENTLAVILWTVLACAIFYSVFTRQSRWRWIVVAAVVILVGAVSFESKRNAIFLLLPAFIMEARCGVSHRLGWKWVATTSAALLGAIYLILAMSQLRGYGGPGIGSLYSALLNVPSYVASRNALAWISNNFELGTTFYHSHFAVKTALLNEYVRTGGATYLRMAFVGIPEQLVGYRPPSIVESYTMYIEPSFRAIGGSYPPTALGEAYWNFGRWALLAVLAIFAILDRCYRSMIFHLSRNGVISGALMLTVMEFFLLAVRGGGFDILLAYSYLAVVVTFLLVWPLTLLFELPVRSGRAVPAFHGGMPRG